MEFLKLIQDHRSIRKYKNLPIEKKLLDEILLSGTRASTSSNMQYYSIIATQDLEIRKKLFAAHSKQQMILEAPVLLTFCADQKRVSQWMSANEANYDGKNTLGLYRGIVDACLVAQNIAIAAEASGLGICYMGSTLTASKEIAEILNLPDLVFPVTSMVLGHPAESPSIIGRLDTNAVIHWETYENRSPEKCASFYKERDADAWTRLLQRTDVQEGVASGKVKNAPQAYVASKFRTEFLKERSSAIEAFLRTHGFKHSD